MNNKNNLKPLAEFLPYQLSIASNAVSNLIARQYRDRFGLKMAEWRVMAILGDIGAASQSQLVDKTRMDKVTVNRACKALSERHLIARTPNHHDRRSHHLNLTDAGEELYREIMTLAQNMESEIIEVLSAEEREQLTTLLARLLEKTDILESQENMG